MKQFVPTMHLIADKYVRYSMSLYEQNLSQCLKKIQMYTNGVKTGVLYAGERLEVWEGYLMYLEDELKNGNFVPDDECNVIDENGDKAFIDWKQMYIDKYDEEVDNLQDLLTSAENDEERQHVINRLTHLQNKRSANIRWNGLTSLDEMIKDVKLLRKKEEDVK